MVRRIHSLIVNTYNSLLNLSATPISYLIHLDFLQALRTKRFEFYYNEYEWDFSYVMLRKKVWIQPR